MGMFIPHALFQSLVFKKHGQELKNGIRNKVQALTESMAERGRRIAKTREENGIDDVAYAGLLEAYIANPRGGNGTMYEARSAVVAGSALNERDDDGSIVGPKIRVRAGVIADLREESEERKKEVALAERIERISRNLDSTVEYDVSEDDLKFLGM